MPSQDLYQDLLSKGVRAYSYHEQKEKLERFYSGAVQKELTRNIEDYKSVVEVVCGVPSTRAVLAFKRTLGLYDKGLKLDRAAWELGAVPQEVRLSLGLASRYGVQLPALVTGLTEDMEVPRDTIEDGGYILMDQVLQAWRQEYAKADH
jgi:hypothetical protein